MDTSFPITLLRDLPVYSGSVDPHGVHVLAVVDGRRAWRVPFDSIQSVAVVHAPSVPEGTGSSVEGDMAWDSTGLYVHGPSGWGKTAVYMSNWDDLTPSTRFLRVDAVMDLTDTESSNARESLGLVTATVDSEGLVRLAGSMSDTGTVVPTAAMVASYVDDSLAGIRDDAEEVRELASIVRSDRDEVSGMLASVEEARDEVSLDAAEVHADMARAVDAASSAATSASEAALSAQEAAEAASAIAFDETPVIGSRNAVRSGGVYSAVNAVDADVSALWYSFCGHETDIGGPCSPHVTPEERERWNSAGSGGGLTPEQEAVLNRLAAGSVAGGFSVWTCAVSPSSRTFHSYMGSSGPVVDIEGYGVNISSTGPVQVHGGLKVDCHAVLTCDMTGSFEGDEGTDPVDGLATVLDATRYVSLVREGIVSSLDGRYVPLTGDSSIQGSVTLSGRMAAANGRFYGCLCVSGAGIGISAATAPYDFQGPRLHRRVNDLYWGSTKLNGGGGEGDVTADGDNYFTGDNTFTEPLMLESNALQSSAALYNHGGHLYWGSCRLDKAGGGGGGGGDVYTDTTNVFTGANTFRCFDVVVHSGICMPYDRVPLTTNKRVLYGYGGDLYWGTTKLSGGDSGSGYAKLDCYNVFTGCNTFNGRTRFDCSNTFKGYTQFSGRVDMGSARVGDRLYIGSTALTSCNGLLLYWDSKRVAMHCDVAKLDCRNDFTGVNWFCSAVQLGAGASIPYVQGADGRGNAKLVNYQGGLYWGSARLATHCDLYGFPELNLDNVFTGQNTFTAAVEFNCTTDLQTAYFARQAGTQGGCYLYNYNGDLYWGTTKLNGGGGGGDVYADGDNYFTGNNMFNGPLHVDSDGGTAMNVHGNGITFSNNRPAYTQEVLYNYNCDLYWGCTKLNDAGSAYAKLDCINVFNGSNTFSNAAYIPEGLYFSCSTDTSSKLSRCTNGHLYWGCERISSPPEVVSTVPSVLRHGRVYSIQVTSGTVDLSGVAVESMATAELYIDYTDGTLALPTWWWLDGMSSSEGDHDIPPWGQDMEAGHRYVVTVRNDGMRTVANIQYDYPMPS